MWKWRLLCWLIRTFTSGDERLRKRFIGLHLELQKELNAFNDRWVTNNIRLKDPPTPIDVAGPPIPIALVMQGKLMPEEDFTLKTIRHYRQTFPGSMLIVSTWKDEDPALLKKLEQAGAQIVQSEHPPFPGPSHINYQLRSTLAGIEAARQAGCEYILKTRTDTRMYATNISDYLVALHRHFPIAHGAGQKGRLLVLDIATRAYIPHHPSDIMMFGLADDLWSYWSTPFCEKPREAARPVCNRFRDLVHSVIPEVYLCRKYLDRLGYPHEPSINSWWRCLSDLFLVVDRTALEHFWFKYNYTAEHHFEPDHHRRNEALCSFRDWLAISTFGKRPRIELAQLLPQRPNALLKNAA